MRRVTFKRCVATGKRMYKRHQEAANACGLAGKLAPCGGLRPVSFYRCEHCKRWHLTSMTQIEYQVAQIVRGGS